MELININTTERKRALLKGINIAVKEMKKYDSLYTEEIIILENILYEIRTNLYEERIDI